MLEKNNVMLLNDIIYKIHTIEDFDTMRISVLESLQFLIPFDTSGFFLSSEETPYKLNNPIAINASAETLNSYLKDYQDLDYTRWTFAASSGKAYRETDLLKDSVRINTPYYQEMFVPLGMHFSMLLTIIHKNRFLGVINLFRSRDRGDFTDDEIFLFELLEDHLGYRCACSLGVEAKEEEKKLPDKKELIEKYNVTLREIQVIYMLLDGIPRETIADKLCISPNTLKKHILNIYKKLNINSWRELFQLMK